MGMPLPHSRRETMQTRKLYQDDPYQTTCDAEVVAVSETGIELDQTVFFGESGGQVGDRGSVASSKIIDARPAGGEQLLRLGAPAIDIRTTIIHIPDVSTVGLVRGDVVHVAIDWQRRYRIMRMHS